MRTDFQKFFRRVIRKKMLYVQRSITKISTTIFGFSIYDFFGFFGFSQGSVATYCRRGRNLCDMS